MSKRVKFSAEEKLYSVNQVLQGRTSRTAEAKRIGIRRQTLEDWIREFEEGGAERLKELRTWTRYSEETKLCAVKAVVDGVESNQSVLKKYAISSLSVLNTWISKYTSGQEIKSTSKGSFPKKMIKGRKTTYKERLKIVHYTIAHGLAYDKAIEKYQVSYQQVYSWEKNTNRLVTKAYGTDVVVKKIWRN